MPDHAHTHASRQESGNALWFILMAIVLLAALTIVISRSGSSVNQSGDVERERIAASDMMRTAKGIEQTVRQMQIRGLGESQISFDTSALSGYTNPNCDNSGCKVYDKAGGGLTYSTPKPLWLDKGFSSVSGYGEWVFTHDNCIAGVGSGTSSCGTGNVDILIALPGIRKGICTQINRMLDLPAGDNLPVESIGLTPWIGTISSTHTVLVGDNADGTALERASAGCYKITGGSWDGAYVFYQTLFER